MQVWHMSGAGNDFMVMDARGLEEDLSPLAKKLCAITHADGFMALDTSDVADFKLHFYNSDGSRGEMCGNGARCICRFAWELGLVKEDMSAETDAGLVSGWRISENRYRMQMNLPGIYDAERKPAAAYIELGDPGIPHAVVELSQLDWEDAQILREQAVALRYDPVFPKGANISFYTRLSENTVRVLTYERWVEDYTLACGTGCTAIAVDLWMRGRLPGGVLTAQNQGGDLQVTVIPEGNSIDKLFLEGPVEIIKLYEL